MTTGLKVDSISSAVKFGNKDQAALTLMAEEMKKIRRQFERIKQDKIDMHKQSNLILDYIKVEGEKTVWDASKDMTPLYDMVTSDNKNAYLLADIHYLLISLAMIGKLFIMLRKALPDAHELRVVAKNYELIFKDYSEFRASIEHIYDKLKPEMPNHGGQTTDEYFFGDKHFNIGKQREEEIERIHNDIRAAVKAYRERTQKQPPKQQ